MAGLGELSPVTLRTGEERDFDGVVAALADAAYSRVDMVSRRGEFAVRGGLIDVFPPTEDHPVRIEFFGDEIEPVESRMGGVQYAALMIPAAILLLGAVTMLGVDQAAATAARSLTGDVSLIEPAPGG